MRTPNSSDSSSSNSSFSFENIAPEVSKGSYAYSNPHLGQPEEHSSKWELCYNDNLNTIVDPFRCEMSDHDYTVKRTEIPRSKRSGHRQVGRS